MAVYVKSGGSWRDSTPFVKSGGTWREATTDTSIKYNGAWRNFIEGGVRILAWGAGGGGSRGQCFGDLGNIAGGAGGFVDVEGPVSGTLTINVAGGGRASNSGGNGGWPGGGRSPYHSGGGGVTTIYLGGTLLIAVGAGAGAGRSGTYSGGSPVGDGEGPGGAQGGNINVGGGAGAGPGFSAPAASPGGYLNGGPGSPGRGAGGGSGYYGGGGGRGDNGACDGNSGAGGCSYINSAYFPVIYSNAKSANNNTPPGTGSGFWGNNAGYGPPGRSNGSAGRVVIVKGGSAIATFGYTGGGQSISV